RTSPSRDLHPFPTRRSSDLGVIAHNVSRKDKALWTENDEGERAAVYRAWDEHEEANFVAQTILAARNAGAAWDDLAVFYRTNAQDRKSTRLNSSHDQISYAV